jgi:transposase InsO family protein
MRVHRNAKTTITMRQLIATRAEQGWTYAQIGAALGLSVRTVAKWVGRARQAQLADGSSRPHRQPRRLATRLEMAIVALRRTRATAWQISVALRIPRSTVTRVLARVGLNRVALLEPAPPVQRYEWPHVGDLVHDLKRLGRVTQIGHRIHGDRRRRGRRVGWEYLHVAIDDATRLTYAEVLAAADAPTCAAFVQRTLRWCHRRGIRVRRLLTDNALAYRAGALAAVCGRWAVRQRFTRPYRPQTNGKAERFIQTLLREWAYRVPYRTSAHRTAALAPYLRFYNHRRPHASLGRRAPWTRFQEAA